MYLILCMIRVKPNKSFLSIVNISIKTRVEVPAKKYVFRKSNWFFYLSYHLKNFHLLTNTSNNFFFIIFLLEYKI